MGVRGLQSFIEDVYPNSLEPVNIGECASAYTMRTKKRPVLLIDGNSTYRVVYQKMDSAYSQVGLFKEFESYYLEQFKNYSKHNIECIVFIDGAPNDKRESFWINKKNNCGSEIQKLFQSAARGDHMALNQCMVDVGYFFWNILIQSDCTLIRSVQSADDEILDYAAKKGCFGILAQDTDFIIMDGIENYFSAKHLDKTGMTTMAYRRRKFAANIGIDESFLPLFATLCGNDVVTDEDLRSFHLQLIQNHHNFYYLATKRYLPKKLILQEVANWIRSRMSSIKGTIDYAMTVSILTGLLNKKTIFEDSLASYKPSNRDEQEIDDNSWTDLIKAAEKRHRYEGVDRSIFSVLTRMKYYLSPCNEIYNSSINQCSSHLTKNLRKRFFGILLKDTPRQFGEIAVSECVYYGHDIVPTPVRPEFPDQHPGLIKMWLDPNCSEIEKMRLLCWAVSKNIDVTKVLQLDRSLRISYLTAFFLIHEVKSGLTKIDIEALIATAVHLLTITLKEVKALPLGLASTLETHIKSVYLEIWSLIAGIDDACGNPVDIEKKSVHFDGKVFHHYYTSAMNGTLRETLPCATTFQIIMDSLYNKV